MRIFNWIFCFMYGHEPDKTINGFVVADYEFEVSLCRRCECTIVFDPDMNIWDKW